MTRTKLNWQKPHGKKLIAVDKALKAYEKAVHQINASNLNPQAVAKMMELKNALSDWCIWKNATGKGWRNSERNRDHAVEELWLTVFGYADVHYEFRHQVPQKKLKELLKAQKTAALRLLFGYELNLKFSINASKTLKAIRAKSGFKASIIGAKTVKNTYDSGGCIARDTRKAYKKTKIIVAQLPKPDKNTRLTRAGSNDFKNYMKTCIPIDILGDAFLDDVCCEIFNDTLSGVLQAMAPFWGCAKNGVKAVNSWRKSAMALYYRNNIKENAIYFDTSLTSTDAALNSLSKELNRMMTHNLRMAGLFTTAATAQGASIFLDGGITTGPAIEAVRAVASMMEKIYILGRGIREMVGVNMILKDPEKLDDRIFTTCPLLGCYFLRCTEISSFICLKNFGKANWQKEVERHKKAIDKVRETAGEIMLNSFFAIDGLFEYAAQPNVRHQWKMEQYTIQRLL
ncbi:MAG: hypothetical protein GY710_03795 [Desulfobacteraceae bacterium]|nr:hypothetical protein [Desulfobacteraceae bacterium]